MGGSAPVPTIADAMERPPSSTWFASQLLSLISPLAVSTSVRKAPNFSFWHLTTTPLMILKASWARLHPITPLPSMTSISHASTDKIFSPTYCTISNTVKAIGIGGSASLFLSAKFTSFIASSDEADARNLVALTRSKGLSVILLPPATQFVASPLHSLLTQCAYRHGIFNIGAEDLDIEALADFISQPDTTQDGEPAVYTSASYLHTHQISTFGTWDPLPLCLALTYNSYFYLSLNQHLPPSNTHTITAAYFEWGGKLFGSPPIPATISFGRNCLLLVTEHSRIVEFPFPTAPATLIEAPGLWASARLWIPLLCPTLSSHRPQTSNPSVYPKPSTSTPTHNPTIAAFLPRYLLSRLA